MTQKFLQAKHWQIFLLTIGIPLILQITMMISFLSGFTNGSEPHFETMQVYFKVVPFIGLLFMTIFMGWFWSITGGLQNHIPEEFKMKLLRFKIFFFIPVIYITIIMLFMSTVMNGLIDIEGVDPGPGAIIGVIGIIMPFHLFSMFCIFHSLYFAAKAFKTAELQRKTTFSDFAGEFFLLWFFPIGIWIIQPKINKIVDGEVHSLKL